jgi:beta-lactamase class C
MMSKLRKLLSATLLLFYSIGINAAPTSPAAADPNAAIIQQTVAAFMQKNNIPGVAVEVYQDGKAYSYYVGYADRDKKTPVTKDTIFEVGSISKIMTSVLLAQEIDSATVALNDPITKYMPQLPESFDNVSLLNLATHTSGLPFNVPEAVKNEAELYQYLDQSETNYTPNKQWVYSNFGIGVLGYTLENVTHKNFNQLYRRHILLPLRMREIGLTVPKKLQRFYAQGYDKRGNPVNQMQWGVFPAAGGLKLSANDMQRFLSAAIGLPGTSARIFYPMRMTETAYVRLSDRMQGLGWQIHLLSESKVSSLLNEPESMGFGPLPVIEIFDKPVYTGDALIDKTGATDGFSAYIALIPNKKSGVVILTNRYVSRGAIVNAGRDILFKLTKMT